MNRTAALVFALLLAGCGVAETSVRVFVEAGGASLTELEVRTTPDIPGEEAETLRTPVVSGLLVRVPDEWDGSSLRVAITGLLGAERYSHGEGTVVVRRGEETETTVVLARLPCGAWCEEGATRCEGDGVVVCEQRDADDCFEWSEAVPCGGDAPFCSLGTCLADCIDECAPGETRCASPGSVLTCGDADSDECVEWMPAVECASGETCSAGRCGVGCIDECEEGSVACSGSGVVSCGDLNRDGCREWGPIHACGRRQSCEAGVCVAIDSCSDECSASMCAGLNLTTCGNFDLDPCLEPSPGASCAPADPCLEGRCTLAGCESAPRVCDAPPAATCIGDTLRTFGGAGVCGGGACAYPPTDTPCPFGCESGTCVGGCDDVTCSTPPSVCYASTGACDPLSGSCSYAFANVACDDGNSCTTDDRCASGTCSGTPRMCSTPPSVCYAATGSCSAGTCSYGFADGASCDDGDPGTTGDTCSGGACRGRREWPEFATGGFHACARRDTGEVYCWGSNRQGQLGIGTASGTEGVPRRVTGLTDAIQITAGLLHTCALRSTGQVLCWGRNQDSELGDGTITGRNVPTPVVGLAGVDEIVAGANHTCARWGGTVYCWGRNRYGQVGDGTLTGRSRPTRVVGLTDATQMAAGLEHTCVRRGGDVACWGRNEEGALGDGTTATRLTPTAVPGITDAVEVTAGLVSSCARRAAGAVMCWGNNNEGSVGDGTTVDRLAPALVAGLSDAVMVSAGGGQACAARSTGGVQCWGSNESGQVGDGSTTYRTSPRAVVGLSGIVGVRASLGSFTCAGTGSSIYCWGGNLNNELGDGTLVDRYTPVRVMLPR